MSSMVGPSFENPPAVERVLTVQFQELPSFDIQHYGLWYKRIQDQFPVATRQPALPKIVEQFPFRPSRHQFKFEVEAGHPLPRMVCKSALENATRLHQIQPDRFSMNWLRSSGEAYLRFDETSQQFVEQFANFETFLSETSIGPPRVDLCEVTYVNLIPCLDGTPAALYAGKVFVGVDMCTEAEWLPIPSAFGFNRMFDMEEERGRLYAEVSKRQDESGEAILLKMTGRTVVESDDDWHERLKKAHEWVVNGFVAITESEIRRDVWRQNS